MQLKIIKGIRCYTRNYHHNTKEVSKGRIERQTHKTYRKQIVKMADRSPTYQYTLKN